MPLNTLYIKLSAALVLLFMLIGLALVLLTRYSHDMYYQEVTQRLNSPVAMYVAGEAPLIENGRITDAVTNLRFTQSFVDCFGEGKILGLGDDARFADSEFAPGIMYVPTMHLASWSFTGGAEG